GGSRGGIWRKDVPRSASLLRALLQDARGDGVSRLVRAGFCEGFVESGGVGVRSGGGGLDGAVLERAAGLVLVGVLVFLRVAVLVAVLVLFGVVFGVVFGVRVGFRIGLRVGFRIGLRAFRRLRGRRRRHRNSRARARRGRGTPEDGAR